MKTLISLGFLIVGLAVISSDTYAAGNKGKGNVTPNIPQPSPAAVQQQQQKLQQQQRQQAAAQQAAAQQAVAQQAVAQQAVAQRKHNTGKPGYNGPVGQGGPRPVGQTPCVPRPQTGQCPPGGQGKCPTPNPVCQKPSPRPQWNCTKTPGPTNGNGTGNWNANKNGNKNGNTNANDNKNSNKNSNRINNSNDVNVNVSNGGGPYDGGFGGGNGGGNGGGYGYGGGNGGGNGGYGYGGVPGNSYTGGNYSPTGGTYAPTYAFNPSTSYDFSNNGGFGAMPALGVAAVGLPPVPNAVAFNEDDPDTAWITLELPNEEAEVWLNGAKMPHKGLTRKYVTPPLEKDKIYNYEIKVQWPVEKGRPKGAKLNYSTMLQFKAGDEILHKVPEEGDGKAAAPPMPKVEAQPQDEEKLMNQRLNWAKELFKEGKTDAAKQRLKDIVNKSPDSAAGKEAKELLSKIQ